MGFIKKWVRRAFMCAAAFALVGVIAAAAGYYVVFNVGLDEDPDGKFNRNAIVERLSGETRVFYRDGKTRLGAFFDANHRIYVPYGDIPEHIVHALVAAEDSKFFEHHGFDFKGFSRAMITNLRAGSMRQGGSTLTQQTVKNIFGREERSLAEKYRELRDAIKLERHFSKEEILEFYLNQFHVAGSGKGVAIAAQYFFNKQLKDLTLAECAFIAGSVKGPFNYDPFAQRTEARRDRALERGRERVGYVLGRMLEDAYITKEQYEAALAKPLEFNHGTFRYSISTQLALIEEKLNSDYFQKFFDGVGIDDWRRAQLTIVSTIDDGYQDAAKRALQSNISDLQLKLGGFVLPSSESPNRALKAEKGDYLYGALDSAVIDEKGKINALYLNFGQVKGVVERATLDTLAKAVKSEPEKLLASKLAKGSVLLVSVLDSIPVGGLYRLKLETEPNLQGALVALQNGEVLASQGGFHNTGFDRSFKALRQLGSSWKPLLYTLSFKRGWNYLDELENSFNVFQYGNQYYFPRPDHKNKGDRVSIAWSATRSENISSVWLLDRLYDKLSVEEFAEVMEEVGYAKTADEDNRAYFERLRDKYGLTLKDAAKQEIEFDRAKSRFVREAFAENRIETAWAANNLLYGSYMDVAKKLVKGKDAATKKMLEHNFKSYEEKLRERRLAEANGAELAPMQSVELYPNFTLADFAKISAMIEPVDGEKDYMAPELLFHWPDFRRSLAMADFAKFANEIGIHSKLQKVQSMVLGVNDVSIAEITMAYETILTGKVFKCKDTEWSEPCLIREIKDRDGSVIFRNAIEEKQILDETITSQVAAMLRSVFVNGTARSQYDALSLVSDDGRKLHFPAFGKTGTTNDFRNVAFLGALPNYSAEKDGFATDTVVAIGSYVGFDNNKPLKSGSTRIAGASGGLPQWASLAKEILRIRKDASHVDFYSIQNVKTGEIPLLYSNLRGDLKVDAIAGLATATPSENAKTLPWLEVPGFTPPQVQSVAAEAAAFGGFVTAMPAPTVTETASEIADSTGAQNAAPAQESAAKASDDDWELPADFDGENAFVPVEVEF